MQYKLCVKLANSSLELPFLKYVSTSQSYTFLTRLSNLSGVENKAKWNKFIGHVGKYDEVMIQRKGTYLAKLTKCI